MYDTSSWKITKDSKSKFDHVMVDVSDLHISKLATGRELIWTVMTQINFWNLETGDERIALKTVSFSLYATLVSTKKEAYVACVPYPELWDKTINTVMMVCLMR